ncbi:MAG: acetaldehyde dehydrogenase (acetylating) [Hellea sp.]|nr:acetaldehyde dehydrogenase (acetylating) [Hellea sp.]
MNKVKVAIIGSGNIGTDLMIKIDESSSVLEVACVIGIDANSEGLAIARERGFLTTHEGIEGAQKLSEWKNIKLVFDATSAYAHGKHAMVCASEGKQMIDLTPAALGPFCVPVVNMDAHLDAENVNMVTCGGQATIPMVAAVSRVSKLTPYAEIVASVSSRSAGPGTRANIDEFTRATARGIEVVGGAQKGKAIIILNPAEPPMIMRDTVYVLSIGASEEDIKSSVAKMVKDVQAYVPGYRLKQEVQFEKYTGNNKLHIPGLGTYEGTKVTIFLEVEGAGHYLPKYAGNLDIMTSAGMGTAEAIARKKFGVKI